VHDAPYLRKGLDTMVSGISDRDRGSILDRTYSITVRVGVEVRTFPVKSTRSNMRFLGANLKMNSAQVLAVDGPRLQGRTRVLDVTVAPGAFDVATDDPFAALGRLCQPPQLEE
jgi:hypothetical protein